ncbi:MAG: glutamate--cysteine ligase [Gammaproteobacteria bacterium]|nr:glutamate--cysteine ligase [Gammaproteobacteria bacterium]MBU2678498.1 glutamate--cysteine ligase [Gammaproteobacteria bacterium]
MKQRFEKRLAAIAAASGNALQGGLKGVEKESLRVAADGYLSSQPHPVSLGSALTNRYITTDFSEALLEFVTPAFATSWEALQCLCDIHQFTYSKLGEEMLWSASMPCLIPVDADIPLAQYGPSNVGRMKTIYRRGLGHRYGRQMQLIAGVHFNYSLPTEFWPQYQQILGVQRPAEEFRSDQYLNLIRNFRRLGWLILYLFGASPALCKSFASGAVANLKSFDADTYFAPYGTSLRMSDLGYSNKNQSRIGISLNSLDEYVGDLSQAICTREPAYEKIGVKVDGQYRQLNANLLQIENEFYSPVRPKRVAKSGEQPTAALRRNGIEYVEIRSLDINPFDPSGINQNAMRFVEALLIYCLLDDSPKLEAEELNEVANNHAGTAKHGRDPDFRLLRNGLPVTLREWSTEILSKVLAVAELIDSNEASESYADAVRLMQKLVDDPHETPSARMLLDLEETQSSFFEYAVSLAKGHSDYFASITPLEESRKAVFEKEVADSLMRQEAIEAADDISLDDYLQRYFSNC